MAREKIEDKKKRALKIIRLLKKHYPGARCTLDFKSTHQLMVATILSAQCTDERVNKVTPDLFKKYKSIKDFAKANLEELKRDIYSTGFHKNKARAIKTSAIQLLEMYDGHIPKTLVELVKLQGVGRKTGSVILGAGYGLAEGVVVDTHVGRISRLFHLTDNKDPVKVEKDLMQVVPGEDWIIYAHLLIDHGRAVCKARQPDCQNCFLNKICPSANLQK